MQNNGTCHNYLVCVASITFLLMTTGSPLVVIYLSRFYIYFVFIYLYLFVYYFGEVGGGKQYNCFPLKIPTRTGPGPKVMELKKKK